jgi:hypothetical protein
MSIMFNTFGTVFSRFYFELYETDLEDLELRHAYMAPYPKRSSKGARVMVNDA